MMQLAQQAQNAVVNNVRPQSVREVHSRTAANLVSAYVFVSCAQPKRIASALRRLPGVVKADALLGASEAVLVVERGNFESLQTLLAEVQATPGVKRVSVKLAA